MAKHELHVGESVELEMEISHLQMAPAAADWGTSDSSVVSVEETGTPGRVRVTGVAEGSAKVTLNLGDGYDAEEHFEVTTDPKAKVSIKVRK